MKKNGRKKIISSPREADVGRSGDGGGKGAKLLSAAVQRVACFLSAGQKREGTEDRWKMLSIRR